MIGMILYITAFDFHWITKNEKKNPLNIYIKN